MHRTRDKATKLIYILLLRIIDGVLKCKLLFSSKKSIEGVSKIKDGYNPATWMLEVTSPAQEMALGLDFTEMYRNSDLYR